MSQDVVCVTTVYLQDKIQRIEYSLFKGSLITFSSFYHVKNTHSDQAEILFLVKTNNVMIFKIIIFR